MATAEDQPGPIVSRWKQSFHQLLIYPSGTNKDNAAMFNRSHQDIPMEQTVARFLATSAAALALAVPLQAHVGGNRGTVSSQFAPAHPAESESARPESESNMDRLASTDRPAG